MSRRLNGRALHIHRSYTVEELARSLGTCQATVRRWIKLEGLAAIADQKPFLILGSDARAFLAARRRPKHRCALDEFYCLRCRVPRRSASGGAVITSENATTCNIRALCEACDATMHKRVSRTQVAELKQTVSLRPPRRRTAT